MNIKQFFDKHYKRLVTEGILKSAILGALVCFVINFIFAFLYWMFAIGSIWLGIGIGTVSGIAFGVALYFLRYNPTEKTVAGRIDRYGFEERMITMLELREDESFMADMQRRDARKSLDNAPAKIIRFNLSKTSLMLVSALILVSISLTVLGGLAKLGKIPYGKNIFGSDDGMFDVVYATDEGGIILGNANQSVSPGENTSAVLAIPSNGWIFVGWDDGGRSPQRYETEVEGDMIITAVFEKIDKNETDPEDESDFADDIPFGSSSSESGGGSSDNEGGDNPEEGGDGQGGGKWQDKNQFIDGATYYRDYLELYYQYAMEIFDSNGEIPPELIEFFETYFSGI